MGLVMTSAVDPEAHVISFELPVATSLSGDDSIIDKAYYVHRARNHITFFTLQGGTVKRVDRTQACSEYQIDMSFKRAGTLLDKSLSELVINYSGKIRVPTDEKDIEYIKKQVDLMKHKIQIGTKQNRLDKKKAETLLRLLPPIPS